MLAAAVKPRDAALVALLGLNGLRISEALGANVDDLSWERGHRTLRVRGKGGKLSVVPLAPRTVAAVDALIELSGDELSAPIFRTRTGARLDRYGAHKIVRRLARKAGIDKAVSAHSFRHGFVTNALDAGVSLKGRAGRCEACGPTDDPAIRPSEELAGSARYLRRRGLRGRMSYPSVKIV
jgi:integrase/recombinase XerD